MNNLPYFLLALTAGALLAVQTGVNAQLRSVIGNPVLATLVSFVVGTLALLVYLLIFDRGAFSSLGSAQGMATYKWLGGVIGAIYVCSAIVLAPKIGAANLLGLVVGGQVLFALLLDHYGWLGFQQHSINFYRLGGACLLIAGVVLILKN